MSVLETHDLSIRFGGVQANARVSVAVGEREIVGVIGPNGAGKTTLFNMITGFYAPDSGRILYRERDITRLSVHERAALGLGRTFQNVGLVKGATVRENLITAQ
jgi:branched-chain amino acid transport system ATP-binding protein